MIAKLSQTEQVLSHLISKGSITSWEAIEKYGATRLSAIIYTLRKRNYIIENERMSDSNRQGKKCSFVNYRYCGRIRG